MSNPLTVLWRKLVYAYDRTFKTGNRRAEFETKYAESGDYFGYFTSPYELAKYSRTLQRVLELRRGRQSLLEIGCSVGAFTRMVAPEFDVVVATDIAEEALKRAAAHVGDTGQVSYVRSDLLALSLDRRFDVILCAEVLYYIPEPKGPAAAAALDQLLAANGLVIEVCPAARKTDAKFFHGWDRVLGERFDIVFRETVPNEKRPYEIVAYARRA
jgi:2-polyprenyl-3-methyl-5-hydroxy-6-metoxy-1,4-benzoquinol methylase